MLKVSNTNGKRGRRDFVRVYLNGALVAEVSPRSRNPLGYLRAHPASKYRAELLRQLNARGIAPADYFPFLGFK